MSSDFFNSSVRSFLTKSCQVDTKIATQIIVSREIKRSVKKWLLSSHETQYIFFGSTTKFKGYSTQYKKSEVEVKKPVQQTWNTLWRPIELKI